MTVEVKSHMSKNLITIHWSASLTEAYELMNQNRIRHLPVVDQSGKIEGILSERDLQRALQLRKLEGNIRAFEMGFDSESRVKDYMSWPVQAISDKTTLKETAQIMVTQKISALLVAKGDEIVGIVTTDDLLTALIDLLDTPDSDLLNRVKSYAAEPTLQRIASMLGSAGI